jgi:archaetidylinositol phosphate synthase
MLNPQPLIYPDTSVLRPWDARLARRVVAPLVNSRVTPNHLTTLRLGAGLAAAAAFAPGGYGWSNLGALLLVLSNFLDHTDGELARMSGKTSRLGHVYDLASDALVTILVFVAIGVGAAESAVDLGLPPVALGAVAGIAIAVIFYLRMRIEALHGKAAIQQASLGGFETEDVLYLFPLVTLSNSLTSLLFVASIFAPLYAVRVVIEYHRLLRRDRRVPDGVTG